MLAQIPTGSECELFGCFFGKFFFDCCWISLTGMVEIVIQKLSDNFNKQAISFQDLLYTR